MKPKIRNWTFTHWWVRPLTWFWFRIYHKTVTVSEEVPVNWNKPTIFAPTHQNAFSDALCLILPARYTNNNFIYPLIRADAFGNNKFTDWVLTVFHMIPVFRPRDKVDLKAENEWVFSSCYNILSKNRNLLIHPEGNCVPQKQVRPFKKGLARIAFGAEIANSFKLGLQIVPVGINYRDITGTRKGVHIRYGKSVLLSDYHEIYKKNEAIALRLLTRDIQTGVKNISVNIESASLIDLTESLFKLLRDSKRDSEYTLEELKLNQRIAKKLNQINKKEPEKILEIREKTAQLNKILEQAGLEDCHFAGKPIKITSVIFELIYLLLLSPLMLYGFLNNAVPWYLMNRISGTIKEDQFKSSGRLLAGLLLFPLIYLIQGLAVSLITGSAGWTVLYLISLPVSGILSLHLIDKLKSNRQLRKIQRLQKSGEIILDKILELRNEILSILGIEIFYQIKSGTRV